jgi:hypothetical protein
MATQTVFCILRRSKPKTLGDILRPRPVQDLPGLAVGARRRGRVLPCDQLVLAHILAGWREPSMAGRAAAAGHAFVRTRCVGGVCDRQENQHEKGKRAAGARALNQPKARHKIPLAGLGRSPPKTIVLLAVLPQF